MKKKETKVEKITSEELEKVKTQQNNIQKVLLDLGALEARKLDVFKAYEEFHTELESTKKELEGKYGQVNIDLKDGIYTPIEKAEPTK
tara:strand:- start:1218 stop:1481 length:264 start_codon:yes stop_codon:yes gene_type:complete